MALSTDDFYALVKRMRNEQKTYFATRSTSALGLSKRLERLVDVEICEYEMQNGLCQ